MANKDTKPVLERLYNVPLRKQWLKVPRHRRANKAVKALKTFLSKHMKSDEIRLGMHVNEYIWSKGIKNPPHHVKVHAVKDEDGVVKAELEGYDFRGAIKSKPKEEAPTGLKGKLQEAMGTPDESEDKEEDKEDKSKDKKESKDKKKSDKKEEKKSADSKNKKKSDSKKKSSKSSKKSSSKSKKSSKKSSSKSSSSKKKSSKKSSKSSKKSDSKSKKSSKK